MMLADHGAEVIRVDRLPDASPEKPGSPPLDPLLRGRRSIAVDLKHADGVEVVLRLTETVDVVIEAFRPGVCERLGVGPGEVMARNPRLIYARMTGWGQDGPYASAPGHDINYIALSGALGTIGQDGSPPVPPNNFIGDFGGGGMMLAFGITCALLETARSGKGQVIDAAMIDGAAALTAVLHGLRAQGEYRSARGNNLLDGGAYFYRVYETADCRFLAVGAVEKKFHDQLLVLLGIDPAELGPQFDRSRWPAARARLAEVFRTRTRDEWCQVFDGSEACVTPVLALEEVSEHPHNRHRNAFVESGGLLQPAPAPRFSRTACSIRSVPAHAGEHTAGLLAENGFSRAEIEKLRASGAIA